ncbi:MAG TPA: adenylate kinase [Clostridiales bacterium]|nr:adenylate kinase [Clostridiales bacterium]
MKVIMMGPPGSGKGTQAELIKNHLGLPHISTGEIFRENIRKNTQLGQRAGKYIEKGQLVPDELTCEMLFDRIEDEDCKEGYILDGFPRTIEQAERLDKYLTERGHKIDKVLNMSIPDQEVIRRLSGRRVCSNCEEIYHIDDNPPAKEGLCNVCGSSVIQRKDDLPEIIKARLDTYYEISQPLISYYNRSGLVTIVDGTIGKTNVTRFILSLFG